VELLLEDFVVLAHTGWSVVGAVACTAMLVALVGCSSDRPATTTAPVAPVASSLTTLPSTQTTSVTTVVSTYVVESGDSLAAIAGKFNVTMSAIMEANNITDPNRVLVGQKLTIPPTTTTTKPVPTTTTQPPSTIAATTQPA
jgi:LysM repeat protein